MKMKHLCVVSLAVLWAAGVSFSQESVGPAPAQPAPSVSRPSSNAPKDEVHTVAVAVKYYPVNELENLLRNLSEGEVNVVTDERTRRLIITAPQKRMDQMLSLIRELDKPNMEIQQAQYLMYRVYMLELPSKDQKLKPFSMLLERSSQLSRGQFLDAVKEADLQFAAWSQSNEWLGNDKWGVVIQGRAASNEVLKRLLESIPDAEVRELKWDDETFTAAVPAAQVSRLPTQLQDHLRKFLGEGVQTVGYWFGGLSVPGEVEAPIGPWKIQIKAQSGQGTDLVLEVRVSQESPIPFLPQTQLLSNTVQGKVGRPVIIGYNRDSYGTRVMGAMVVLLDADTTAPATGEAKTE
jgi:hypothetical protein